MGRFSCICRRENTARGIWRSPEQGKKVDHNKANRVDLAMKGGSIKESSGQGEQDKRGGENGRVLWELEAGEKGAHELERFRGGEKSWEEPQVLVILRKPGGQACLGMLIGILDSHLSLRFFWT